MIEATRRVQFCAGHRILNHESKCSNMHGHNYVALFTARGDLDGLGRVIDFSVLKDRLGGWIEEHWDHGFIAYEEDRDVCSALDALVGQKVFLLVQNPTAENMAHYLLTRVAPRVLAGTGVEVVKVRLWETENCYAEVSL